MTAAAPVISLVAACSRNRVIGRDGGLPWRLPADLKRFRELTVGRTVVMGRKTYESLPDTFRPLPDRRNLVVTSDAGYDRSAGIETFPTLEAALAAAGDDCVVIGGGQVYAAALPLADRVHLTEVDVDCEGDTFFPELDDATWRVVEESDPVVDNDHRLVFRTYARA